MIENNLHFTLSVEIWILENYSALKLVIFIRPCPGWPDLNNTPHQEEKQHQGDLGVICWEEETFRLFKQILTRV